MHRYTGPFIAHGAIPGSRDGRRIVTRTSGQVKRFPPPERGPPPPPHTRAAEAACLTAGTPLVFFLFVTSARVPSTAIPPCFAPQPPQ